MLIPCAWSSWFGSVGGFLGSIAHECDYDYFQLCGFLPLLFSFFFLSSLFFLIFVSFSALFSVRFHFSRESEEKCVALCSFCCISGGPASAESLKSGFVRRAWVPSQPFGLSFTIWVSDDESASAVRDVNDDDGA